MSGPSAANLENCLTYAGCIARKFFDSIRFPNKVWALTGPLLYKSYILTPSNRADACAQAPVIEQKPHNLLMSNPRGSLNCAIFLSEDLILSSRLVNPKSSKERFHSPI